MRDCGDSAAMLFLKGFLSGISLEVSRDPSCMPSSSCKDCHTRRPGVEAEIDDARRLGLVFPNIA